MNDLDTITTVLIALAPIIVNIVTAIIVGVLVRMYTLRSAIKADKRTAEANDKLTKTAQAYANELCKLREEIARLKADLRGGK